MVIAVAVLLVLLALLFVKLASSRSVGRDYLDAAPGGVAANPTASPTKPRRWGNKFNDLSNPMNPNSLLNPNNPMNPASLRNPNNPANPSSMLNPNNPANPNSMLNPANPNSPLNPNSPIRRAQQPPPSRRRQ